MTNDIKDSPFIKMREQFLKEKDQIVARYESEIRKLQDSNVQLAKENKELLNMLMQYKDVVGQLTDDKSNEITYMNIDDSLNKCSDCSFDINIVEDSKAKQLDGKYLCEICRGDMDKFFD